VPGLSLTAAQGSRLLGVRLSLCETVLQARRGGRSLQHPARCLHGDATNPRTNVGSSVLTMLCFCSAQQFRQGRDVETQPASCSRVLISWSSHPLPSMPEGTLKAFADHGEVDTVLPDDGGDSDEVIGEFAKAGISVDALGAQLQDEEVKSVVSSWNELMAGIASKRAALNETVAK
jgi:hypothetical protein